MKPCLGNDRDVDLCVGQELSEELSFVGDRPGIRGSNNWETIGQRRGEDGSFGAQWCCLLGDWIVGGRGGSRATLVVVTRLFSVGSMILLRREKKERGIRDGIDDCEDDAAVDLLTSMHNYLWSLKIQRKKGLLDQRGLKIKAGMW